MAANFGVQPRLATVREGPIRQVYQRRDRTSGAAAVQLVRHRVRRPPRRPFHGPGIDPIRMSTLDTLGTSFPGGEGGMTFESSV